MSDLDLSVAFPQEASYPLPYTLPGGIKEVTLRQVNYNAIPGQPAGASSAGQGVPSGLEIQVVIPQLDGCFGIPETAYLHIEAELDVAFNLNTAQGSILACGLSPSNGGILGSACSLFNRYQVYLNTAILSDDIIEFGLLSHLQFLLAFNRENRFAMAAVLGLNRYYPSGVIGQAFNGPEPNDRAYLVAAPTLSNTPSALVNWATMLQTAVNRTLINSQAARYQTIYAPNTVGSSYLGYKFTNGNQAVAATFAQTLRFAILLPGILGSGSNKLFPLFIGPTRISLYTDLIQNYTWFNFPAACNNPGACTSFTATLPPVAPTVTPSMYIRAVWLNIDYIRCDGPSFALIVESLPIPDTFVIKSTAWAIASTTIPITQGQSETLIPHRRASCKCLYVLFSPSGGYNAPPPLIESSYEITNTLAYSCPGNIFGKYGWVNPNLSNGTCVTINGIMYPQQTNDPLERPDEMYSNLLRTLGVWSNDGNRPCIAPNNFFVTDTMSINVAGGGGGKQAETLWRPYQSLSARVSGYLNAMPPTIGLAATATAVQQPDWEVLVTSGQAALGVGVAGTFNIAAPGAYLNFTDHSIVTPSTYIQVTQTAFTANAAFTMPYGARIPSVYLEGSMSLANYQNSTMSHNAQGLTAQTAPECNQFIYAVDFEHMAKNTYLSGVSSLSGSFFFRANIKSMLTCQYNVYFVLCYDMLTILNYATRSAVVKI